MYRLKTKKPSIVILIKLISSASIGAVLFTPGLPAIIRDFQVSRGMGQFTLTIFIIGYALGQLLYAPLANRWGRKPAIYIGMTIGIIGSFLAAISGLLESFSLLLWARFIMAIGTSVGLVLTFTIINDFFYAHQARKVVPYVSLAFAVIPFIGVTIGGFLVHSFGWESCFYFLMGYNLFILLMCMRLPETTSVFDKSATKFSTVGKGYFKAFKNQRLVVFSTLFGLTSMGIYLFAASAPLIVINQLKISPDEYGILNLYVAAAYLIGNLVAARLSKYIKPYPTIAVGYSILSFGILSLAGCFFLGHVNLYTVYIPFCIIYLGIPISFSNLAVLATSEYEDRPTASAVMNFIGMSLSVIGVLIIGALPTPLTTTLPAILLINITLYFFLLIYAKRYTKKD